MLAGRLWLESWRFSVEEVPIREPRAGEVLTRRERRLPVSAFGRREWAPAVWGDEVAFLAETKNEFIDGVLVASERGRVRLRLRGSTPDDFDVGRYGKALDVDLRAGTVLFAWDAGKGGCEQSGPPLPDERRELWIARPGRSAQRIAEGCPGDQHSGIATAVFAHGHAWWITYATPTGAPALVRFDPATRRHQRRPAPRRIGSFDIDGEWLAWWTRGLHRGVYLQKLPSARE